MFVIPSAWLPSVAHFIAKLIYSVAPRLLSGFSLHTQTNTHIGTCIPVCERVYDLWVEGCISVCFFCLPSFMCLLSFLVSFSCFFHSRCWLHWPRRDKCKSGGKRSKISPWQFYCGWIEILSNLTKSCLCFSSDSCLWKDAFSCWEIWKTGTFWGQRGSNIHHIQWCRCW